MWSGKNCWASPLCFKMSLTVDEEIILYSGAVYKRMVSTLGFNFLFIRAIVFSYSKSSVFLRPLIMKLALFSLQKSTVSPEKVATCILFKFSKVLSIHFFLNSILKRHFLLELLNKAFSWNTREITLVKVVLWINCPCIVDKLPYIKIERC